MTPMDSSLLNTQKFFETFDDLLAKGHAVRFRASGLSMYPAIRDGDLVTVESVDVTDIRRGDVLLCRLEHTVVAHRLVRIIRADDGAVYVELRGDAAFENDSPEPFTSVIGRVTVVAQHGRDRAVTTRRARALGMVGARVWRGKRAIVQCFLATISQTSARSSHARP
jgi:signal peptidase I